MTLLSPWRMIGLGLVLVLAGVLLPLLMLLDMVPAGFALSFLAYAASVGGVLLGILGSAMYVREKRPPDEG